MRIPTEVRVTRSREIYVLSPNITTQSSSSLMSCSIGRRTIKNEIPLVAKTPLLISAMSVNYGTPHAVDVPVTDLDDAEDDMLFAERANEGDINNLDFDHHEAPTGFLSKVRDYFNSEPQTPSTDSYEMLDPMVGSFEVQEEDPELEEAHRAVDLRDYKIKRLNEKLNRTIGLAALALMVIVTVFLFRKGTGVAEFVTASSSKTVLNNGTHNFHPTTIVISLDGFHPHYISAKLTPTLHNLLVHDYGAPYMVPSFPSSTFPNHWTLVTGLYPSEHGIVGNTFFDPVLEKQFINTDPKTGGLDPDFWRGGEPVWTTAFKQGVNSAIHMWPGSEVPGVGIDGGGPLEVDRYNGSELLSSKVDRVMRWIDTGNIEERPELILTYVPTIDQFGHKYGISGLNLTDALTYVDDFVRLMQLELQKRHLSNIANLIIVLDHGMAPTSDERLLFLDDIIDMSKIEHTDGWPLVGMRPIEGVSVDELYGELSRNLKNVNFEVFKVEDLPAEWNFGGQINDHRFNYRLAPVWIVPKVGYSVTTHKQFEANGNTYTPKGVHGYNNTEVLMRAIFLGTGPYFEERLSSSNRKVRPFANTEVYNMICESLKIQPAANNGSEVGVLSLGNSLPDGWTDNVEYPDLPYEVEHIIKGATYDLLWKRPNRAHPTTVSASTNDNPYQSLVSEESSLSEMQTEKLPKPTDFSEATDDETVPSGGIFQDIGEQFDEILDNAEEIIEESLQTLGDSLKGSYDRIHGWLGGFFGGDDD